MKIQEIALEKIRPYENNPKTHTDRQVEAVAESIKRFGAVQPIVVDPEMVIIIGHCRYEAALALNLKTFPVVIANLNPEQAKALRIIDNRTNESEWNTALLSGELKELVDSFELTTLGFSEADLLELTRDIEPDKLVLDNSMKYVRNANAQLMATRVILTYKTPEEERWLLERLGVSELGVVAYVADLIKA